MWVTNANEKKALDAARREVVTAAVHLPMAVVLTLLSAVLAVGGGVDDLPAPVWWVLVGVFVTSTWGVLHDLLDAWREYRLLTRCSLCLDAAVTLAVAQDVWDSLSSDSHPHSPTPAGDGA